MGFLPPSRLTNHNLRIEERKKQGRRIEWESHLSFCFLLYRDSDSQTLVAEINNLSQRLNLLEFQHEQVRQERDRLFDRLVEYET
jgi:hypothetical protein